MIASETLSDGTARLRGRHCTFATRRVRPGVLFTRVTGRDDGEFGRAPLEALEREHDRFGLPVSWFIDAGEARGASPAVLDTWTAWLQGRPAALEALHVWPGDPVLALNIGIARHLSGSGALMRLHGSGRDFRHALQGVSGQDLADASPGPAALVQARRESRPDGSFDLCGAQLRYAFAWLAPRRLLTTVQGEENGELGDAVWDALEGCLDRSPGAVSWRLDLRGVTGAAAQRAAAWSAWLARHAHRFSDVVILAPSAGLALFLLEAQHRTKGAARPLVLRDAQAFSRFL